MLQLTLLLLVIVAVFWAAVKRPKQVFFCAVFLAPWSGLEFDVGVRLTGFRIVMATLAMASVLRLALRPASRKEVPVSVLFVGLCIYAVIWSLVQIPFLPIKYVEGGELRSPVARAIIQILMFGLDVSPILVVPLVLRKADDLWQVGRMYIVSCVALASLGWFQIASWYGTEWNPLPIGFFDNLLGAEARLGAPMQLREGIEFFRGMALYRMNSLGGEPRDLAGTFAIALILLQVAMVNPNGARHRPHLFWWTFLFVSMVLTLSTSGLVLWLLGTLALGGLQWGFRSDRSRKIGFVRWVSISVGLPALTIAGTVALLSGIAILPGKDWFEYVKARTIGRNFIEDFDAAVIGFLKDQPRYILAGVGLGNVHLYATYYLPEHALWGVNAAFVAKSGYLRLISEIGIAGLALFLAWVAAQIRILVKISRASRNDLSLRGTCQLASALAQFATIICVLYMARGNYIAPQTFLTLGLVVALSAQMLQIRRGQSLSAAPTSAVSSLDDRMALQQQRQG